MKNGNDGNGTHNDGKAPGTNNPSGSSGGAVIKVAGVAHHAKPVQTKSHSGFLLKRPQFPDISKKDDEPQRPLTARTRKDMDMVIQKTALADILWSAILGKENVAKTTHRKPSLSGSDHENSSPMFLSKFNHQAKSLGECTDTVVKTETAVDATEPAPRPPVTKYKGECTKGKLTVIDKNLTVNGKPIMGFGLAATVIMAVGSADTHPGNFSLVEKADRIQLFKFDNKLDFGADASFNKEFFTEELARKIEKDEALLNERVALCENEQEFTKIFEKEKSRALKLASEGDKDAVLSFSQDSKTMFPLPEFAKEYDFDDLDINKIHAKQFMPDAEEFGNYRASALQASRKMIDQKKAILDEQHQVMLFIAGEGEIDTYLKGIFPTEGNVLFNFPFSENFAKSAQIKNEFFEGIHLFTNMNPETLREVTDKVMGKEFTTPSGAKVSDLIFEQLNYNIATMREAIKDCPEYTDYVGANKGTLEKKVKVMHDTLETMGEQKKLGSFTNMVTSQGKSTDPTISK